MATDALKLVMLRNNFYRDNFRRLVMLCLFSVILNIVLIVVVLTISQRQPKPIYFATTQAGQLIQLKPLNQPIMSSSAIRSWVESSIPQIYEIDFLNYRRQIQQSRKLFTATGWSEFLQAFRPTVEKIINEKLVASAVPTGVPVIIKQGVFDGKYSWQIQVPLVVTFQKGKKASSVNVVWQIILQRVSNLSSNELVGISQIVQTMQKTQVGSKTSTSTTTSS